MFVIQKNTTLVSINASMKGEAKKSKKGIRAARAAAGLSDICQVRFLFFSLNFTFSSDKNAVTAFDDRIMYLLTLR